MQERSSHSSDNAGEKELLFRKGDGAPNTPLSPADAVHSILQDLVSLEDNYDRLLDDFVQSSETTRVLQSWNSDLSFREFVICNHFYQALDLATGNKLSGGSQDYNNVHQHKELLQALRSFYRATGDHAKRDLGREDHFSATGLFFSARKIDNVVTNACGSHQSRLHRLLNLRKQIEGIIEHTMQQPESERWPRSIPGNRLNLS